ncbi:uncharacterized protein [Euwallacea fornicatus]|uniref:uncharacterized protein n=1 Tax=Euwallacea fornicatus TaxID=995702 RepID=UPI0033904F00
MDKCSAEEVIACVDIITQVAQSALKSFREQFNTFQKVYLELEEQSNDLSNLHSNLEENIKSEHSKCQNFIDQLIEDSDDLKKAESSLENLQKIESIKLQECEELKNKIDVLKKKSEALEVDSAQDKRDEILAYKVLTRASFVYSTKKITGIVASNPPQPFYFKPQETSQHEITERLWDLIVQK